MIGSHIPGRIVSMMGTIVCASLVIVPACATRQTASRPPATAPAAPPPVQTLYESGQDSEVVSAVSSGGAGAEGLWFAAHSDLRLGRRDEASTLLTRLVDTSPNEEFRVAAQLELAILSGDTGAIDNARAAAAMFPNDPFVQYELGAAHAVRNDFAAAAQAFDACGAAAPRFAYAYYQAGLAYEKVGRLDLTVVRFETFLRLAPGAPERPQVESILKTA